MTFKKTIFAALLAIACAGCFSTRNQLNVSTVYPFEGRYGSEVAVTIDGKQAEIKEGDSIWILSNHTVYNLLTSVSDHPDKVIFGNRTYSVSKNEMKDLGVRDTFDDEEYVWQNWNVPDSGGK